MCCLNQWDIWVYVTTQHVVFIHGSNAPLNRAQWILELMCDMCTLIRPYTMYLLLPNPTFCCPTFLLSMLVGCSRECVIHLRACQVGYGLCWVRWNISIFEVVIVSPGAWLACTCILVPPRPKHGQIQACRKAGSCLLCAQIWQLCMGGRSTSMITI